MNVKYYIVVANKGKGVIMACKGGHKITVKENGKVV